jgi:hypothetical protein
MKNFLSDGCYVGNIFDFINKNELEDINILRKKIKIYMDEKREERLKCIYTASYNNTLIYDVKYNEVGQTDLFLKDNNLESWQKWYSMIDPWNFKCDLKNGNVLDDVSLKIIQYLYPQKNIKKETIEYYGTFTLFENGHYIENHRDGNSNNRVCNILIYLNDEHKDGDGGELVLTTLLDEKITIKPKFGNFAVLDFTESDGVEHCVNMVNGNFKRYTYMGGFMLTDKFIK